MTNPKSRGMLMVVIVLAIAAMTWGIYSARMYHPSQSSDQQELYYCPMHPSYTSDRPGSCPICNMTLVKQESAAPAKPSGEKKILYWTDPMLPGYKSDKPGKSPMGMELVPVYEEGVVSQGEAPQGYASVQVAPYKQQLIGIKTATVEKRFLQKEIRAAGHIAYDPMLYQAEAEYLSALQALRTAESSADAAIIESAQRLIDASRTRLHLLGLGEEAIDQLSKQNQPDKRLLLADPKEGAWVYASIYEFELPWVSLGQTVQVTVPSLSGQTFQGTIVSIDPVLDPATRTARVRAVLTDPSGNLRSEMFVDVIITISLGEMLAVPQEAVFDTGSRKILFVDKGDGVLEPREIQTGAKAEGYYEIKEGVSAGERVVTNGNFLIDSESRLKAALEGMGAGGHSHGQ